MSGERTAELLRRLRATVAEVAHGRYEGVDALFDLTRDGEYPPEVADLAESFGLMVMQVATREYRLEGALQDLQRQRDALADLSAQLAAANLGVLETLGSAVAKRDHDTSAHNYRVTLYAVRLGEAAGLDHPAMAGLVKGAFLHDVGKIGIPDRVLLKPGPLTTDEFELMKKHVQHGVEIVSVCPWLADALPVVSGHHERFGGGGYPANLAGEQVPRVARVFAIADVFDAIISERPYKPARSVSETLAVMADGRGGHFDPDLLDRFLVLAPDLHEEATGLDEVDLRSNLRCSVEQYFPVPAGWRETGKQP